MEINEKSQNSVSSISNTNRLIVIDCYRLLSILIDWQIHRLCTPGTITSQSYSDLLKCDFVKNLYLCHLIKEILVRYFLANFLKRCVLLRLLQKSCKELGKILLIGLIKILTEIFLNLIKFLIRSY